MWLAHCFFFFFFNDTATTEIYTLSLHDALPILPRFCMMSRGTIIGGPSAAAAFAAAGASGLTTAKFRPSNDCSDRHGNRCLDRKSTRLNSSHANISYAVFCLKKKTVSNDS